MSNTSPDEPLVAVISGVAAAVEPARLAIRDALPMARVWNILDDQLISRADEAGEVTGSLGDRMHRLVAHAAAEGADGVLLSCSLYGFLAAESSARVGLPVIAPDDAAFAEGATHRNVAVLSGVAIALVDSVNRFEQHIARVGSSTQAHPVLAVAARQPSLAGDAAGTAEAVISVLAASERTFDAVMLANFSLGPVRDMVASRLGLPVIAGAPSAARALRDALLP